MKTNLTLSLVGAVALLVAGCAGTQRLPASDGPGVVELTAVGLEFQGPDEIPSGWTTFRFNNASAMTHFAVAGRYPEGKGVVDQQKEVAPVFQEGMDLLNDGNVDAAMQAFGKLPAWFGEVVMFGGPGLLAPGRTGQSTVYLEPGVYVLECYVKTDGVFHSYNPDPDGYGMVHEITVTETTSGAAEPVPTLDVTISREGGIAAAGDVEAGPQTVAVRFEDQGPHEHFVGHDVHLVRLNDDTDRDALESWMDWTQANGLETPAPAEFIGGVNEMPAGEVGYFTVDLEPGRYAWISEVPNAADKGMLKIFTVPSERESSN